MVLFAILAENMIILVSILSLILISPAVNWGIAIGLFFLTEVLHAQFVGNLRHLRFFEVMGTPSIAEVIGSRSSFIARSLWLTVWPGLPFLVPIYRGLEAANYIPPATIIYVVRIYYASAFVLAVPALVYFCDAMRWRVYAVKLNLAARRRPGVRIIIVGSYYFAVENFNWPSLGEEKTNRAYASAWTTKLIYNLFSVFINQGPLAAWYATPAILVDVTLSSYISLFGLCWIVAHVYHFIFSRWLSSMGVILTPSQMQIHDMQKYDLSGHLLVFAFQASLLSFGHLSNWDPLYRLVCFLLLFRLSKIQEYTASHSQMLSMEGTGQWRYYIQAVFEGAVAPFCLGLALFLRIWRVPSDPTLLATSVWEQKLTLMFPADFELFFHAEGLLLVGDLSVGMFIGILNTIGYPAHLFQTEAPHFWHRYIGRVNYFGKVWSQVIRELIGMFVHFVILSYLFEKMWQVMRASVFTNSGFTDIMSFMIYFGRYADGNVRFSYVMQNGLNNAVVCSYRCVIQELPTPVEDKFRDWHDVCGICQAHEEDRLTVCEFPCNHFFHRSCIEEWLKIRMVCPMCMRKLWFDNGIVRMENVATTMPEALL